MKDDEIALRFMSRDGHLNVDLTNQASRALKKEAVARRNRETGGILIGRYSDDLCLARIEVITGEPFGSRASWNWFTRGSLGLKRLLRRQWRSGLHYLGEWHSHPLPDPTPSQTDLVAMIEIAKDPRFSCSMPILLIVGMPLDESPILISVTVLDQKGDIVRLGSSLR